MSLSTFVPNSTSKDATPRVIADIEGLARRVNALIQQGGSTSASVQQINNTPPPPPQTIIAGAGLVFESDNITLDVNVDASTIVIVSDVVKLGDTAVTPNTYGDATHSSRVTVDQQGRLTAASSVAITGTVPDGTVSGQILVWSGTAWVAKAMSGDATIIASGALTLASIIAATGPIGSTTTVPVVTVDVKGRVTALTTATIATQIANGTTTSSTLRWSGSAWVESTFLLNSGTQVQIGAGGSSANVEFTVLGTGGTQPQLADFVENVSSANSASIAVINSGINKGIELGIICTATDFFAGSGVNDAFVRQTGGSGKLWFASATATAGYLDTSSNRAALTLASGQTGPTSGASISLINFGSILSNNVNTGAQIACVANETWSDGSALGSNLYFYTVAVGSATLVLRMRITPEGTIHTNASGSALATSATNGFLGIPNMAGTPTGTPAARSVMTGATNFVWDDTNRILRARSTSWFNVGRQLICQTKTANYTVAATDDYVAGDSSGGNIQITLPDAAANPGRMIHVKNIGTANNVTVILATLTDKLQGTANGTQALAGAAAQAGGNGLWIANGTDWQRIVLS